MSPDVSAAVAESHPSWARAEILRLTHAGILVFLTAVEEAQARGIRGWMRDAAAVDAQAQSLLRLITPGAYHWPAGSVQMPLDAALGDAGLTTVHRIVTDLLPHDMPQHAISSIEGSEFIALSGPEAISPTQQQQIWDRCGASDIALGVEGRPLEANRCADGRLATVIAPEIPSTAWFHAITRAERVDPRALLVVTCSDESASASMQAFAALLDQARQAMKAEGGHPTCVVNERSKTGRVVPPDGHILAPRITAPSDIHFIKRWNGDNRRYVREHYWKATQAARCNVARAADLLLSLDRDRYARASDLVRLAELGGGQRLFDDFSGAVCFEPGFYEFELPSQTGDKAVDDLGAKLRAYFDAKLDEMPFDRPLLRRRMFSNSLVLLRGDAYYANLKQVPPWERAKDYMQEATALEDLFRGLLSEPTLKGAVSACMTGGSGTESAWKLLLGAMDQARNLGLILLSVASHRWRDSRRPTVDHVLLTEATKLVKAYYAVLLGDTELDGTDLAQTIITGAGRAFSELRTLRLDEEQRATNADWYDPEMPIRNWREADSPYENLQLALLALERAGDGRTAALGLFWGGVELPIVASVAADLLNRRLATWGFLSRGRYSSSATQEDGFFCDLSTSRWRDIEDLGRSGTTKTLILDDNALSGGTLESARDLLVRAGVREVETWVVRFSGERREGQMRMVKGGMVEPAYLANRLNGFLGETPYARSYSRKRYESPVGVFNTARSRILRYLHNNSFASKFEREGF
ncbi:hypothetical protein ACIQW5_28870 [Methylorubrum thiocyanatum]|uniref:hypothetical protein n=1 Tax=Methylorubrum thiocyanatum TaxID=47958 RepID=UPI00383B6293